jgi:hypothetical protein
LNLKPPQGLHEELNRKYWFAEIDPLDTAILNILKENPATPFLAIAEQLQLSIERVMAGLQRLNEANAIKIAVDEVLDSTQRVVEVTKGRGKRLINANPTSRGRVCYPLRLLQTP